MKYFLLLVMLFVFNGCALNRLFLSNEVDKVNVVKYNSHTKHHRAYFVRSDLKPVIDRRKFLFLYNKKRQSLALLLRRGNTYLLYNFTNPKDPIRKLRARAHLSKKRILNAFAKIGYYPASPLKLGFETKIGLRRYKGLKTLLVDVKDYRKLIRIYKHAIKHYQAKEVLRISTPLPAKFIRSYLIYFAKRTKEETQREQLRQIAQKAHIALFEQTTEANQKQDTPKPQSVSLDQTDHLEGENGSDLIDTESYSDTFNPKESSYNYYLHHASMYELSNYLDDPKSRHLLGYKRYHELTRRLHTLKEERLLQEGSLEELITAYKRNRDQRFKKRILELLKEKQREKFAN